MDGTAVTIAIAYDFDGTLAPGNMQEHSFIPKLDMDNESFWREANELAKAHDMDGNLAYMQLMLLKAAENRLPVRKQDFLDHGKDVTFFAGVESFFDRINKYGQAKNVRLEHHIISSGLREIIQGTSISKYFRNIFASGYVFDENEVLFYINPFNKGAIFTKNEIEVYINHLKLEPKMSFYKPCSNSVILQRLLESLITTYSRLGYSDKVDELKVLLKGLD